MLKENAIIQPSLCEEVLFSKSAAPMDDRGLIPEELEKILEANKDHKPRELTERKPYWSLLYVMTTIHNPRGMCLPPGKCLSNEKNIDATLILLF